METGVASPSDPAMHDRLIKTLGTGFLCILLGMLWLVPVDCEGNEIAKSTILYGEDFDDGEISQPLYERYPAMKVSDGVLTVRQQVKHNASPTLPIAFRNASLRYRFRIDDAQLLACRFEEASRVPDAQAHLCRLEIRPHSVILKMDTPPKDKGRRDPAILAQLGQNYVDGKWHQVELRFEREQLTVRLDDGLVILAGKHQHLAEKKIGTFFVIGGGAVSLDDLVLEAFP